jgi:hypothetical protein
VWRRPGRPRRRLITDVLGRPVFLSFC